MAHVVKTRGVVNITIGNVVRIANFPYVCSMTIYVHVI